MNNVNFIKNIDNLGRIVIPMDIRRKLQINTGDVLSITCLNYLVSGYNSSGSITAMQDIYILGSNNSTDIKARDVLVGEDNYSLNIADDGGLIDKVFGIVPGNYSDSNGGVLRYFKDYYHAIESDVQEDQR